MKRKMSKEMSLRKKRKQKMKSAGGRSEGGISWKRLKNQNSIQAINQNEKQEKEESLLAADFEGTAINRRGRLSLSLVAGKNFFTWKGQNYEDYLQHDSLFKFRQSSEERVFYVGLNRVVESITAAVADDAAAGNGTARTLEDKDVKRRARRTGSGLCEVIISLTRAHGESVYVCSLVPNRYPYTVAVI